MAKNGGTCLYKEARLNIEPAFPDSTISITLPAASTSTFGLQTRPKRELYTEAFGDQDEDAFARRHLAGDGSMYFRRIHKYPRSFLWRTLDDRKTLEIQATDLDHDFKNEREANLTLLLHFTSPIRPFCVAFAEPEDRDALTVFAITAASELYTITLHRTFFMKQSASELEMSDWCKRSSLNLLTTHIPYRLVAVSNNELLVSLENGGVVRLTRDHKDEMLWQEDLYQQSNWSLRGMLSWKGEQTVRFDTADLSISAAAAMAISPDRKHIITVCLDHRMRIYNIASGKLSLQRDLLHNSNGSHEMNPPPDLIAPSQSTLLHVLEIAGTAGGADYHIVTYSPREHQFKFWGIRDADDENLGIYDAKEDVKFTPPIDELMNATVWTMEEFIFVPGPAVWRGLELWVRARSGPISKVYSLKFDMDDDDDRLTRIWRDGWTTVDSGPLTVEGLRNNPANPGEQEYDPSDPTEASLTDRWLDFLFYPGRFTTATLETAHMYFRKGLDRTRSSKPPRGSLKERLCATVVAFATKAQRGAAETEGYEQIIAEQWRAFYGIVKGLHKRRGESLSLAYDHELDMPWLVLSDYVSAIRNSSESETVALNASTISTSQQVVSPLFKALPRLEDWRVTRLLNAAASFRRRYPPSFQQELKRQVELDLLQSRSITIIDRMEQMDVNCEISQLPTEEELESLLNELGMDLQDLDTDMFFDALQTLHPESGDDHPAHAPPKPKFQVARYGLSALLRVSQEMLETKYEVLLDILFLVLFMQFDEAGEDLSDSFDGPGIFVELIAEFKDCLMLNWLATTVWSHQTSTGPSSEGLMSRLGESLKTSRFPMTQTVLEGVRGHHACEVVVSRGKKAGLLTHWSATWLAQIFKPTNDFEVVVNEIMAILLAQKEYALALEFSKFSAGDAWSTYLQGRIHVALGENDRASICFKKAAHNLALGSSFEIHDSDNANLISNIERNDFNDGLAPYYKHVLSLFEKAKAPAYAADFAHLGLRSVYGAEHTELKTELLGRLFTNSLQTSRFDEAYTALIRHSDSALKHSSLKDLIAAMISQSQTSALLKLPFVGLQEDVDAILTTFCHKMLNITSGPPYHQILYSFRISRGNFRGAASILYERLQRLKSTSSKNHDPADESLTQCYLMIINALASVGEHDQYILAEKRIDDTVAPSWTIGKAKKLLKREVITLDTLRREYQTELDRVAAIETGQFPFVDPTDDMDIL